MERTPATTPAPAGRPPARWAVLCALLLGLFLMHGSPASAAGCHPTTTATTHGAGSQAAAPHGAGAYAAVLREARPLTAEPHGARPQAVMVRDARPYAAESHGARPQAAALRGGESRAGVVAGGRYVAKVPVGHGGSAEVCVSTQARDRVGVGAPGAAAVGWAWSWSAGTVAPGPVGAAEDGRGPPGGRELLLRVCVARR